MYIEAMTYLLRKDLVVQLHAYIFFMIPQHIKMGEEYDKLKSSNNNGEYGNNENGMGAMDETALISPHDKASDIERVWLNKFVENRTKDQTKEFKAMFKR